METRRGSNSRYVGELTMASVEEAMAGEEASERGEGGDLARRGGERGHRDEERGVGRGEGEVCPRRRGPYPTRHRRAGAVGRTRHAC